MCGLSGVWQPAGGREDELAARARAMAAALAHRGPDDEGAFVDAPAGFAVGFRRLAIVDLTPGGHQPMASADGRFVIALNGEIYNYRDVRTALEAEGIRFRSASDTEVALEAIGAWGVDAALPRLWGMFALALWDRQARQLWLARDRLGKKPLYYGFADGAWLFGSELKALRRHPSCPTAIDRGAVRALLRLGYIPAPATVYAGLRKLPPGCLARLDADGASTVRAYWRARAAAEQGVAERADRGRRLPEADAVAELEALLRDAVARRMVADVPLGAFLSGGIDSSVVVALMQAQSPVPVRTFTVGFADAGYDESLPAEAVARHLGTDHTGLRVTAADALAVVPRLPVLFDEPFADSSQIPVHLVSALARRSVTVALSGDGGDEVFGGYVRHQWAETLQRRAGWLAPAVRRSLAGAVSSVDASAWDAVYARVRPVVPARFRQRHPGDKIHKAARVVAAGDDAEAYARLVSQWDAPERLVRGACDEPAWADGEAADAALPTVTDRMMLRDLLGYLPDDILTKVDRASMGVGLEARAPLLDHRVVEWAWRLPIALKVRNGQGKWILRQVLQRHVPAGLVERPKSGFALPLDDWLRGPLREWAADLLAPARIARDGLLEPEPIAAAWRRHLDGGREAGRLWAVLMLQAWLDTTARRA